MRSFIVLLFYRIILTTTSLSSKSLAFSSLYEFKAIDKFDRPPISINNNNNNNNNSNSNSSYEGKLAGELLHDDRPSDEVSSNITTTTITGDSSNNVAATEIYNECILNLSLACLRQKITSLLKRFERMKRINLLGNYVTIIKKSSDPVEDDVDDADNYAVTAAHSKQQNPVDHGGGGSSKNSWEVNDFTNFILRDRIVRIRIPSFLEPYLRENWGQDRRRSRTIIDVNFSDIGLDDNAQGRKKKIKKKQLLALLGLLMSIKMSLLGPLIIAMICLKALKAIILSTISLTISKVLLMQKSNMFSPKASSSISSHGHSSSASSGHGWDRTLQETGTLPYFTYPPTPATSRDNYSGINYY